MSYENIFRQASELIEKNIPFAVATIISTKGSTPRDRAKMIIVNQDQVYGTIGGGEAEYFVINQALTCIAENRSKIVSYKLDYGDSLKSVAMHCGGDMDVYIEVESPRPRLMIVGGGHVGSSLADIAGKLGFYIIVVEEREDFCTQRRFPAAKELYHDPDIAMAIGMVDIDENTWVVIATGGSDEQALREVAGSKAAYIGMLSSRRKTELLLNRLAADGCASSDLAAVHSPVGLDIGAETPEEIAVSILGEILSVKSGRHGRPLRNRSHDLVVVRGGGDLASGVICRLKKSGFKVAVLEVDQPTVIRRAVSFAQALFDGETTIEGIKGVRAGSLEEVKSLLAEDVVPVIVDPQGKLIKALKPAAVVDAIMAKKNLGTAMSMAPAVIALGPGFTAGADVHAVVETQRGHYLGRVILQGEAAPNSGIPGKVEGYGKERVLYAPAAGVIEPAVEIGTAVKKGECVALIGDIEAEAPISGVVRGILFKGISVEKGFKIGDIDPRGEQEYCFTVSDKARAVGGGVLEALLMLNSRGKKR